MYSRIEDVDLFIGAISEKLVPGSTLGPTFQCIVGDQFRRLRLGDRFWYEEPNQVGSFTLGNNYRVCQDKLDKTKRLFQTENNP